MGIIIICATILAVGLFLGIHELRDSYGDGLLCSLIIILFSIPLVIALVFLVCVQAPKHKNYETALYERQVIEYRLENKSENIVGNELLYEDIVEYNNTLRSHKRYHDNFWLNWFYNDKIATIEYIEIKGVENYKD